MGQNIYVTSQNIPSQRGDRLLVSIIPKESLPLVPKQPLTRQQEYQIN